MACLKIASTCILFAVPSSPLQTCLPAGRSREESKKKGIGEIDPFPTLNASATDRFLPSDYRQSIPMRAIRQPVTNLYVNLYATFSYFNVLLRGYKLNLIEFVGICTSICQQFHFGTCGTFRFGKDHRAKNARCSYSGFPNNSPRVGCFGNRKIQKKKKVKNFILVIVCRQWGCVQLGSGDIYTPLGVLYIPPLHTLFSRYNDKKKQGLIISI